MKELSCIVSALVFFGALFGAMSAHAGAEGGGGLPIGIIPADVHFQCKATLAIYVIDHGQRQFASFDSQFELKAKKGERTAMVPSVSHVFGEKDWKLDPTTAENANPEMYSDFVKRSHTVNLTFKDEDYSKTDRVEVTTWLEVPSPYEIFTSRTTQLSAPEFDNSVYFKVRKDDFYSSSSLEISCRQ